MFNRSIIFVVPVLLLAACAAPLKIEQKPYSISWKSQAASKGVTNYTPVEVRTNIKADSAGDKEVSGAKCVIDTNEYAVAFSTPAIVNVPFKGKGRSQDVVVGCEHNGKTRQNYLRVINYSGAERAQRAHSATAGLGLIGAVAGSIIATNVSGDRQGVSMAIRKP